MSGIFSRRSALAGWALTAAVGCGAPQSEICNQYIACVGATSPATLPEVLNVYGRDGACWKSLAASVCEGICRDTLANLRKLPNLPAACTAPSGSGSGSDSEPGQNSMTTSDDPSRAEFAWPFIPKSMYYDGPYSELPLGEIDPGSGAWGCLRDDAAESPHPSIARMLEPNDTPMTAVSLVNPLPVDPPSSYSGAAYEICPDRSKPARPDHDTFKFRLQTSAHVVVKLGYSVQNGDLDVGIFRLDTNPDTGKLAATLLTLDDSVFSDACTHQELGPGTYYAVVRGAPIPMSMSGRHKTAMNRYTIKVYVTTDLATNPCEKLA